MAQKNLQQLLQGMSLHLNGDISVPTGDEYDLWTEALNQSQDDWADTDFDFDSLKKTSTETVLQSGTSISMPSDYSKLDGFPLVGGEEYSEIRPEEVNLHTEDRYVIPNLNGKYFTLYPAAATTCAVQIPYIGRPISFTTLTDVSLCPSDNYLIHRATSKIFLQRDNPKYADFESRSESDLAKMINKQSVKLDQFDSSIKNKVVQRGFRLGVD